MKFTPGQLVVHTRFAYRGAVHAVDPVFSASEDWYEQVARSRPPKDAPWYHVLVDGSDHTTYVAERHLQADTDLAQIEHPLLGRFFQAFDGERYRMRT